MNSKPAIVLAMHGMPPSDFPRKDLGDWKTLHSQLTGNIPNKEVIQQRYDELDRKVRQWPRTRENDLYFFASQDIAESLRKASGREVFVGFNEFCAPSLDEALDQACASSRSVTVITPMMTRGGSHSELDIPQAIEKAKQRNPGAAFHYVWPFQVSAIVQFLNESILDAEKAVTA